MTEAAVPAHDRASRVALGLLVLAWAVALSVLCAIKRRFHLYDDFDFAIFAQAAAQLRHGNLFDSIRGMPWLGDHASLILFAVAPLAWLFRSPFTLLVLQSCALALAAAPANRIARRELGSSAAGLAFAAAWLLQPALGFLNLYEFHPEALCVPFFLCALDALLEGRVRATLAWAALALLGREDAALVVLGMAAYAFARRSGGGRGLAAGLLGLAAASLVVSFGILKPAFNGGEADFTLLYARWGATPGAVLRAVVTHPLASLAALVATPGDPLDTRLKLWFYVQLFAPFLFLPLLGAEWLLLGAPILFERMLADGHEQHSIHFHCAALLLPLVFVAAVVGARRLALARKAPALVPLAALACQAWFGPLAPWTHAGDDAAQAVWPSAADRDLAPYRDAAIARVPPDGGVVASLAFLDRFTERAELHSLHHVLSGHYSISRKAYGTPTGVRALLAESDLARTSASVDLGTGERVRALLRANDLHPVLAAGNLVLYVAGARDTVALVRALPADTAAGIRFDDALAYLGATLPRAPVPAGAVLPVRTEWRRVADVRRVYALGWVLLDDAGRLSPLATEWLGGLADAVHLWPAGVRMEASAYPVLPRRLAPGRYVLALRVGAWDGRTLGLAACDAPAVAADRMLCRLGTIEVAPPIVSRPVARPRRRAQGHPNAG